MRKLFILAAFTCLSLYAGGDHRKDEWEPTHLIWNFGLIQHCDVGLDKSPIRYFSKTPHFDKSIYRKIKKGDWVWVRCRYLSEFCKEVLPSIRHRFVLIISDGDESFPSDVKNDHVMEELLNNKYVMHIFAQNCDYRGPVKKISPIPIGIDFHTVAYKGIAGGWGERGAPHEQEAHFNDILSELQPTYLRKMRAFVDFQLSDTTHGEFNRYLQFGEDRAEIFQKLLVTGLIDYSGFMKRSELWKTKGKYAFSISPHGNGLDCHRTWEDLALGCIVIVKTSPLDPLYEGLPVVIIKDWSEITEENFEKWLMLYHDAFTNPSYREKLTNEYWLNKMKLL